MKAPELYYHYWGSGGSLLSTLINKTSKSDYLTGQFIRFNFISYLF